FPGPNRSATVRPSVPGACQQLQRRSGSARAFYQADSSEKTTGQPSTLKCQAYAALPHHPPRLPTSGVEVGNGRCGGAGCNHNRREVRTTCLPLMVDSCTCHVRTAFTSVNPVVLFTANVPGRARPIPPGRIWIRLAHRHGAGSRNNTTMIESWEGIAL